MRSTVVVSAADVLCPDTVKYGLSMYTCCSDPKKRSIFYSNVATEDKCNLGVRQNEVIFAKKQKIHYLFFTLCNFRVHTAPCFFFFFFFFFFLLLSRHAGMCLRIEIYLCFTQYPSSVT